MARGTPDGKIDEFLYASQASDVSIVSNMLWGFSPLDGRGRVVYMDTFNNGLMGVDAYSTGAGVNPAWNNIAPVFSPPYSAKVDPGVVSGDRSIVGRHSFMGVTPRVGIESAFYFTQTTPGYSIVLDYTLAKNNAAGNQNGFFAVLRYDHASGNWQIYVAGGTWTTIFHNNTNTPTAGAEMWIQHKLVCDFYTGKYIRAMIGDSSYDLSTYNMYTPGPITPIFKGYLYGESRSESYGAGTTPGYIGYILITKDEP